MRPYVLLLLLVTCANALRVPPRTSSTRRAALAAAAAAAISTTTPLPAFASKFPQHVEDFDRASRARDAAAIRVALKTLDVPVDESNVAVALDHTGDAAKLRPIVTSVKEALSSYKLTVAVPGATPDGGFIRIVWLRNSETGGLVTVREFKPPKPGAAPEVPSLTASVPKGLGIAKVTPCAYCVQHGIWTGEEVAL